VANPSLVSFGEMITSIRRQNAMTQRKLAQLLGVHINTISAWERGDYLPKGKWQVLEIARQLHLEPHETRQLLEASLTATMPFWTVPYSRNPFFTGREKLLDTIHDYLSPGSSLVLVGLGGIGKTQLAIEYAYRHEMEYSAIFWIVADSLETIYASFHQLIQSLGLDEQEEREPQKIVALVHQWLISHRNWLLIYDNVENFDLVTSTLPPVHQGSLLSTSCHQSPGILGDCLNIPLMSYSEGVDLLLRRMRNRNTLNQHRIEPRETAMQKLIEVFGGLPLALDQVGAYIDETGCNIKDYLDRYEQQRKLLLSRRGNLTGNHPTSVHTTFLMAIQRIKQESPAGAEILHMCAFLHSDGIPEQIFASAHLEPDTALSEVASNPYQLDLAFAALRSFSLISRYSESHMISIHRLTQIVLQEELTEQEQWLSQRRIIYLLNAIFPEINKGPHELHKQCESLILHVLALKPIIDNHMHDQDLADLLHKAASYLQSRAQYKQAELLYQKSFQICRQILGLNHPEIAVILTDLAKIYIIQGKNEQAESLLQQALHLFEQMSNPENIEISSLLTGLARLYYDQGKYEQAEVSCKQALQIREHCLGKEHPIAILSLNNLAEIYRQQGRYEEAETLFLQSIHIHKQPSVPEHPNMTLALNNLGILYCEQNKYEQADSLFQEALSMRERLLGPSHLQVASVLHNLAVLYRRHKKFEQSANHCHRALRIVEQTFGPDHPDMGHSLNELANIYRDQEKWEDAYSLYRRTLRLRKQHLGVSHPLIAETLCDFALFYQKQGNLQKAKSLYQRVLAIQMQTLGNGHPKTLATQNSLQACLSLETQLKIGEGLQSKVQDAYEQLEERETKEPKEGRHGHPRTIRGPIRQWLEDYYQKYPSAKGISTQKLIFEQFGVNVSIRHLNRFRTMSRDNYSYP
jgi:tetratricopeptide (TPR) repeat protein/transcriptional regulator with XRE-family HTH domain